MAPPREAEETNTSTLHGVLSPDKLASQLKSLSADNLAALFKHMNIKVVKQEPDEQERDYNTMQQFLARPCQGQGGVFFNPS
jgi:hypothetical protein